MRAIWIEPEPQESEPLVESGVAASGAEALGEGAASVMVRCGRGGIWMAGGGGVEAWMVGEGICGETARGLILV